MKKINSLKIWIITEIVAIALIAILIVVKTVFADNVAEENNYTPPSEADLEVSADDIERPKDLTSDEHLFA